MKKPKILTAAFCRTVTETGRYGDGRGGHGLTLQVHKTTAGRVTKSWIQRVVINGKPTHIGIGLYPLITLAEARALALDNMRNIRAGRDPRSGIPTFSEAAETVIAIHATGWKDSGKSAAQWRASLRDYAMDKIGNKRIDEITTADVLACILPNWQDKRETMRRVRQRIGAVCKWAIAQGYRADDPTGPALTAALPKNGNHREHFKALPYAEVPGALETVRQSGAYWATIAAFEFLTLTACRSGEVRAATWDEIDGATWTIPADRTKTGKAHRVPLSRRALEILAEARDYTGGAGLIFPAASGKLMSNSTMSKLVRENGIACVPHGMRSSFRQWAAERTNYPREVCELALAHVNKDRVEAAYQRSDLYDLRRRLMDAWAAYLTVETADVVQIA